jgi:RNA polymerase sigma-70 factor (ECF subfamily)
MRDAAEALGRRLKLWRRSRTEVPAAETPAWVGHVAAARQGDHAAFTALHGLFSRLVHGILLAHVPAEDAGDLAQDVFLLAWRRLESLADDAAFGGWISRIARTRAADFHRGRKTPIALPEPQWQPAPVSAEAREVLEAVAELPEAYRETLLLRLVEDMTGPEIAERTGLSPGSVRVNLSRGMKLLRERLGEESPDE